MMLDMLLGVLLDMLKGINWVLNMAKARARGNHVRRGQAKLTRCVGFVRFRSCVYLCSTYTC